MSMIYQVIDELDLNIPCTMVTVLDGPFQGEKAVFANGKLHWCSDENGFVSGHCDFFTDRYVTGLETLDGTRVFCEILNNDKRMVICGGGHVSMPIIKIGKMLAFEITVIEDRPKFADNARAAGADEVICDDFEHALSQIPGDGNTYFVIVTRGHRYDHNCLRAIAGKPHAYIGMIGSRSRVKQSLKLLVEEGVPEHDLQDVHTPIGLSIGAETPEEIAVSIMAEIIQIKSERKKESGFPREVMKSLVRDTQEPKVLATIITRKGSAPREIGTKMLIFKDGRTVGSIGGGCVEASVTGQARRMLVAGGSPFQVYEADMTMQDWENEGMACGGKEDILLELV